ncbi:MAG: TauD/TfdA family dioxygenase [Myxococcota bacterium]|nr:TauD/TfdA family dioxygenase [Myxococcota bacterium]
MDVRPTTIPELRTLEGTVFPQVLSPVGSDVDLEKTLAWLEDHQAFLREQLLVSGAILLRGFPLAHARDFDAVVRAGGFLGMPYIGGAAPRSDVLKGRILTTNESPPSEPIPFHHEMSQVPQPPAYVLFYCDVPSDQGGETPIVLSSRVYDRFRAISPEFADKLEAEGVRYVRVMPPEDDNSSPIGRSWKATFLCDTREEAEARMEELGMEWRWLDGNALHTVTRALPAIRTDGRTGCKTFFNSMVAAYTGWVDSRNDPTRSVRFGDDSAMDGDVLLRTAEAMTEECVAFRWQQGDVLLIDNALVMHSRRPFAGPRRILASIARA